MNYKPRTHYLKTRSNIFANLVSGLRTFEYRLNDRDYKVGDTLYLGEWSQDHMSYTGQSLVAKVTHLLEGGNFGVPEGFVILGIDVLPHHREVAGDCN